jgi:hypothetical protein
VNEVQQLEKTSFCLSNEDKEFLKLYNANNQAESLRMALRELRYLKDRANRLKLREKLWSGLQFVIFGFILLGVNSLTLFFSFVWFLTLFGTCFLFIYGMYLIFKVRSGYHDMAT